MCIRDRVDSARGRRVLRVGRARRLLGLAWASLLRARRGEARRVSAAPPDRGGDRALGSGAETDPLGPRQPDLSGAREDCSPVWLWRASASAFLLLVGTGNRAGERETHNVLRVLPRTLQNRSRRLDPRAHISSPLVRHAHVPGEIPRRLEAAAPVADLPQDARVGAALVVRDPACGDVADERDIDLEDRFDLPSGDWERQHEAGGEGRTWAPHLDGRRPSLPGPVGGLRVVSSAASHTVLTEQKNHRRAHPLAGGLVPDCPVLAVKLRSLDLRLWEDLLGSWLGTASSSSVQVHRGSNVDHTASSRLTSATSASGNAPASASTFATTRARSYLSSSLQRLWALIPDRCPPQLWRAYSRLLLRWAARSTTERIVAL